MIKDVPGGFPKSDLLGVTVALIHVVGQQFLAVLCHLQWHFALLLRNKCVISHLGLKIAQTPWNIINSTDLNNALNQSLANIMHFSLK